MKNSTKLKLSEPAMALYERGTASLSNQHIVSSIAGISMETARQILKNAESIENLATWNINNFMQFTGVGINKAAALVSAFELGRRRTYSYGPRRKISSSKSAYDCLKPYLLDQDVELFYTLFLNRSNYVVKAERISIGGLSGTVVDPKVIFRKALEFKASGLILAHNHPSGNKKPSNADSLMTTKILNVAKAMDIPVLDHIIFTNEDYFSFADEGMI